jgi:DNA excision repair protein ERCC-6
VLRLRLQKQLSAFDREIEAVADGAQAFQASVDEAAAESSRVDRDEDRMLEEEPDEENSDGAVVRGAALHHALAQDRLKSLLKKRKEVRAQLRALNKQEQEDDDVIRTLVEETSQTVASKRKGKKKVEVELVAPPKPVKKAVSFVEDDDFDAALDATSGLMETVSTVPF